MFKHEWNRFSDINVKYKSTKKDKVFLGQTTEYLQKENI